MLASSVRTAVSALIFVFLCIAQALAAPALRAPATAEIGTQIEIQISGHPDPRDFVTIVGKGAAEGRYDEYKYAQSGTVTLNVPATPGDYEIRLLAAESPYATLAKLPLKANAITATLDAPAQVPAGSNIQIQWTGPNNEGDYIGLGTSRQPYLVYAYTRQGNPAALRAPDESGEYELRYFLGTADKAVATRKITIGAVSASVQGPAEAVAGTTVTVQL